MSSNPDRVRVKGIQIHRPIIYGNTSIPLRPEEKESAPPEHTHRWTVAVRSATSRPDSDIVGGADDLGYFLKRVTFKLHESFPNATRNVDKPPFEVTETGWGEFEVQIRLHFIAESGEKAILFYHHLKLHPWAPVPTPPAAAPGASTDPAAPSTTPATPNYAPVHSWQYDEVVFSDPFQNFLNILTAHPPTPLPKERRKPYPFHTAIPASAQGQGQGGHGQAEGVPEFCQPIEKEELERLNGAKMFVVQEQAKWRNKLIEKEKELERLKRELGEA